MAALRRTETNTSGTDTAILDGPALQRAFEGAAAALETQRDALNAINVFPVPDGDTGTNMSLTMRAAARAASTANGDAAQIVKAAADGALMGARGNSGVILSQILSGIAAHLPPQIDGDALADALDRARSAAYRVVSQPREGTMLTAIAEAATAASLTPREHGNHATDVLTAAAHAAQLAADNTPNLLPVLKEAGVVDAGAQGLAVLLDGMVRGLLGAETASVADLGAIDASWLSATKRVHEGGEAAGFCTEFVIRGEGLDLDAMRARFGQLGESLLVVGDAALARVHVHTHTPDDALAYGRSLGAVSNEKVDNMESQFAGLAASTPPSPSPAADVPLAVVAVAAGDGLEELFRSLGAAAVVRGGQTMNPSAGEIRDAIAAAGGRATIVLPNNKNIVLAAEQAAAVAGAGVTVIPTRSIPQGVAALIALNPDATSDENAAAMTEAIAAVRSGEVTLAARATSVNGVPVNEGQPIGLVDGQLAVAEDSVAAAVRACVALMLDGRSGAIVTLYAGEGETPELADAIAATLRTEFACEVEVVAGGQPHYPYLISVE